ncbi:GTP-binding protein [Reyranella sp. CPCC 100927]|uniref:CobW family GTP-binding protein n=1 Tax=Reyranella sp. CPCC 100927 TaxID=2599616 RepID=UPI0011B7E878|nr:GTP-binding protein [Reyranella sp. CPCC 100927]TWT05161.1 GTP-binding protein [Reyranella sp. CPCC 100927]
MNEAAEERIPVSVLTGFLGSGKTTVLRELLRKPEMGDTAVIINEFGEIGLDHQLIEKSDEDGLVTLNSGCLCCTVRGDLVRTMSELYLKRTRGEITPFKRMVVETTGLADPAPILHTLMTDPLLASRFRMDGVVTTVDAVNGAGTLDNHAESVKQAAVADRLLLTKTDIATEAQITALRGRLHQLNPGAPLMPVQFGEVSPADVMNAGLYNPETKTADVKRWLHEEAYLAEHDAHGHHHHGHGHDHHHEHHHHRHDDGGRPSGSPDDPFAGPGPDEAHAHRDQDPHDINRHDDSIRSFCIVFDKPLPWATVAAAFDALVTYRGPDLLRIKGILNVSDSDKPVVVHGVQHVFHPPAVLEKWPDEDHRTRIVFITRDLPEATIRKVFTSFIESADKWSQVNEEAR